MNDYKSFKLLGNGTLRVRAENIIATVGSKDKDTFDLYVAGILNPLHVPVKDNYSDTMNYIWENLERREE